MNYKIKAYNSLCALEEFTINGIEADYEDFGIRKDIDENNAEPYCCGNMQFIPYDNPDSNTLKKVLYHRGRVDYYSSQIKKGAIVR